ncbi:MAG: YihY/virulence factor BrkB family protein [Acidimicrobiales bacterium]
MRRDRVSVAAGAFAYRWFLALFPVIIALLSLAALLAVPQSTTVALIHGVTKALPSGAAGVFTQAIDHAGHDRSAALSTAVVAAAVALWSATSGMVMLEEGLDMAYEVPVDRSFTKKRLLAIPLLLAALVLGGAASALTVFGPQLGAALRSSTPIAGPAFAAGWAVLRWVVALALMALLFSVVYYLAPNQARSRWQWFSPGALLGTVVWALISLGFSVYTSSFGSYDKTYGAFAGVAILIFWLYLTGLAILVGGEVNAAFERERVGNRADDLTTP